MSASLLSGPVEPHRNGSILGEQQWQACADCLAQLSLVAWLKIRLSL